MFERLRRKRPVSLPAMSPTLLPLSSARGLHMHSVLLMKGERLFGEYYWAPFHRNFCHRMYSQTKSYVGVAIGLLEEEGKLSLQDTIASHFPEKIDRGAARISCPADHPGDAHHAHLLSVSQLVHQS